jgi:gliding motility-associated-like protein
LIATSEFGFVDSAYATLIIKEELIFYVPNTFTPDQDDYNEVFLPVFTSGYDPYNYSLLIFNRWGQVVFESHDTDQGWKGTYGVDGDLVQDGTYTWKIDFGLKQTKEMQSLVGHVNVLR